MPSISRSAMTSALDDSENLALSDLALNAAIEIERFQLKQKDTLDAVGQLSKALIKRGFADFSMVPVYTSALAASQEHVVSSKADLFSRLKTITSQLVSTENASEKDLTLLRDFCVALHEALLTTKLQIARQPVLSNRRLS